MADVVSKESDASRRMVGGVGCCGMSKVWGLSSWMVGGRNRRAGGQLREDLAGEDEDYRGTLDMP